VLFNFWEYVAFLANSLVFLLIGLQVNLPNLLAEWQPILWAIGAVLLARIIVVYGFGAVMNRFEEPVPLGAEVGLLRVMAFGVVLFTLLVQGTTMSTLLRRLGIVSRSETQIEYEMRHARLTALRAAERYLDQMHQEGLVSAHTWEILKPELVERSDSLAQAVRAVLRADPALGAEELTATRRELLRTQKSALLGLRNDGVISEKVFEALVAEVVGK